MMAETLEFEDAAGAILDRIRDTPADTLAGILAKLEYPIDEIRDSGVADLRRWLEDRS